MYNTKTDAMKREIPIMSMSPHLIEELYLQYKRNPLSVSTSMRTFFGGFELGREDKEGERGEESEIKRRDKGESSSSASIRDRVLNIEEEFKVQELITSYRRRGHLFSCTNPVRKRRSYKPTLDIEEFGLSSAQLNQSFIAGNEIGIGEASLSDIVSHLKATYCSSVGVEYLHIREAECTEWIEQRVEASRSREEFSSNQLKHVYHHIDVAVEFEQFLHRRFVGQKRFSLEGCESLIPALDAVIEHGADMGVQTFFIGMAHRGRLNVLANIMKKPYHQIFNEFSNNEYRGDFSIGDVKYHLGFENNITTDTNKSVSIKLMPNPSHLEAVYPVTLGATRACLDQGIKAAPIVIHGDAAIASQGVIYETAQMDRLLPYTVGGTIHIVINNQVGFTTNYLEARTSTYCTDIAKVTGAPVFHVNGDDVEAVIFAVKFAMEFREKFRRDIFIDILAYRRHGHNEGDEPRFTQPLLYKIISQHPNVKSIFREHLIKEHNIDSRELDNHTKEFKDDLENELTRSRSEESIAVNRLFEKEHKGVRVVDRDYPLPKPDTTYSESRLMLLGRQLNILPKQFKDSPKITKIMDARLDKLEKSEVDWALAEQLAFASLLKEDIPVRLTGQDAERGTFAHRHSAISDDKGEKFRPLQEIVKNSNQCSIYNSHLSEYGVLGFEFGFSLIRPQGLTIWEAQFGDFSNVAQVMFDQYISTCIEKWKLGSGITLLLPHGYEGQGSEHSSARVERLLQLCVKNNMVIANCTTPANLFHILRRQVKWDIRIPLIILSPKSLLRHPDALSPLKELAEGEFRSVISTGNIYNKNIKRVLFTTGRLFYALNDRAKDREDIAIVRIEQIHPFPIEEVTNIIEKSSEAEHVWVQEEPFNMGAWGYIKLNYPNLNLTPITRVASATPATGLSSLHKREEETLIEAALNVKKQITL